MYKMLIEMNGKRKINVYNLKKTDSIIFSAQVLFLFLVYEKRKFGFADNIAVVFPVTLNFFP